MDNISKNQVLNLINEIKRVVKANKHVKISQELKNSIKLTIINATRIMLTLIY